MIHLLSKKVAYFDLCIIYYFTKGDFGKLVKNYRIRLFEMNFALNAVAMCVFLFIDAIIYIYLTMNILNNEYCI